MSDTSLSADVALALRDQKRTIWFGGGGVLRRKALPQLGWLALVAAVGFAVAWPIILLQLHAFVDGGATFKRMAGLSNLAETIRDTVLLALLSAFLALIIGATLALCTTFLPRSVRTIGEVAPLLPLVVPAVAAVTGWVFLLSPRVGYINILLRKLPLFSQLEEGPFDIFTFEGITIITALLLSSFVYVFVYGALKNMGQELDAAAAACGASPYRRLVSITLPLMRPSLILASGVAFLLAMGQFTAPLLLGRNSGTNVITTEIYYLTLQYPVDYPLGAALGTPVLVVGLLAVLLQRAMIGEQRRFVIVSAKSKYQSQTSSWWAAAIIGAYAFSTVVLPLLAIVYVSLKPFWSASISLTDLTTRHYASVFSNPLLLEAIGTSIVASLVAVAILIPLGFAMAFALLQSTPIPRPLRVAIDFLATLPMAIPASLMGFGLLFAYTQPPFRLYGTLSVLVITYVTLMVGYAARLIFTTLVTIGPEFSEASRTCGAGILSTFFRIILPLTRTGVASMAALTFVLLFHEFSASMMVRSARTQVMGGVLYDVWSSGLYGEVAVLALVMVGATAMGVTIAVSIAGADALRRI